MINKFYRIKKKSRVILIILIIYSYRAFNILNPSFIIIIENYKRDNIFEITFAFFILYRINRLNIDKY